MALVWQWLSLPSMKGASRGTATSNVFSVLKSRHVALGMAASGAFFMGQFTLFTYVRPFLETVTNVGAPALSFILLVIGVAGFIGTALIGICLKRGLYGTLIVISLLMAMTALALILLGGWVVPVAVLLGLWGLIATAAPVGWWSWVAQAMPENAEAGGALMVAVVQLCIALGSTLGGLLFDSSGYRSTFVASAVVLLVAALLTFLASRSQFSRIE